MEERGSQRRGRTRGGYGQTALSPFRATQEEAWRGGKELSRRPSELILRYNIRKQGKTTREGAQKSDPIALRNSILLFRYNGLDWQLHLLS